MNLTQYITAVQAECDDTSERMKTVIITAFNATYRELLQEVGKYLIEEEETTETSVVDQRWLAPADKFARIERVFYKDTGATAYAELEKMHREDYNPNLEEGNPTKFYVKGERIYFDRPTQNAGLVRLIWIPQQIEPVEDDTEIIIDDKYQSVLIYGTTAGALRYEGDQGYQEYKIEYITEKEKMIQDFTTADPIDVPRLY